MDTKEVWKQIKGYPDYMISNTGRVISKKGLYDREIGFVTAQGYRKVEIVSNKKKKRIFIHQLVAMCFLGNPYRKPCVNHIDGNKLNNNAKNLEWVSHFENSQHAWSTGLIKTHYNAPKGESHYNSKLTSEDIKAIRKMAESGKKIGFICYKYDITSIHAKSIIERKSWKHV